MKKKNKNTRGIMLLWEDCEIELTKRVCKTKIEPRIPTEQGLKIPDLCAWRNDTYMVCDVAVASDDYNLDRVHANKVLKYGPQGYSCLNAGKCSSLHSEIAAKCWRIYMQLERSDVPKIV